MAHPPPQHRTLQPTGPPAPRPRLDESLDAIRQEFEVMTQELNVMRGQRDEYESKIASQVNELNIIRQSLYDLETQHNKIRQHYEEEISRARAEGRANAAAAAQAAAQAGSASAGSGAGGASGSTTGPSVAGGGPTSGPGGAGPAPPPGIGLGGPGAGSSGPGGVVGPGQGLGGPGGPPPPGLGGPPGLAPSGPGAPSGMYPGDPYFVRERDVRDRERERELRDRVAEGLRGDPRERELRERDALRDSRDLRERERMGPVNERDIVMRDPRDRERGPSGSMPIGLGGPGPERLSDRERDIRDRDRERERETRDQRERERERDRPVDARDAKRLKSERMKSDRPDYFSPNMGPVMPKMPLHSVPPPLPSQSGLSTSGTAPPSASGPGGSMEGNSLGLIPGGSGPPQSAIVHGGGGPLPPAPASFPDDIDIHSVSPEHKKEGSDWFALFNSKVKRVLDVNLVHTLMHESVVCCVRFSADGKYLATGCNRTAQIYDAKTGQKTCILVDETVGKAGDLYIRSVCFSPDGKYLATGAEDKQIRIWDIAKKRIRNVFDGHQQEIYSLDFSADGRLIVSGSGDKTARIWDMHDGTSKVLTINDPDSLNNDAGVTSVAISPNGQYVAAGSLDTVVRIWDVATAQLVERLRGHRDSVYSVAFTPDGKGLVSGSLDKTLKYWDVSGLGTGAASTVKGKKEGQNGGAVSGPGGSRRDEKPSQCTMNFSGHKDYVLSVAVSHDGQWVVSGSKDRGVQFWDARNALVQCMLQGHKNSVISIDLSPAGNVLATGSGDWQARIWSYTTI
ncbi:WD40-repeat-containing domain protein [Crepidotus variabilis]|uniref:WD40-repeat-containing domain protein n=1 Tax=Crepidotus variabilis TaxID=179855 RepID=A0A9P6JQF3_9AGAR|nr:WD40-repeat-containing domain protein [Crepidotus variabilis]